MKSRFILSIIILYAALFPSCRDVVPVDYEGREVDKNQLAVTAYLDAARTKSVAATVDHAARKIVFNVPYYASDTEPVTTDITDLTLTATLPAGAVVTPGLQTISDLTAPTNVSIRYVNGETVQYEISAQLVKSALADITRIALPGITVTASIVNEDGKDKIVVYRTSSEIYNALRTAVIEFTLSPWATVSVAPGTAIDLTVENIITVTAQDGTEKKYYTEMKDPEYVGVGEIGQINCLFGWQTTTVDPHGFVANKNRSIAVAGNELVVANDDGNFLRFNRFTGEKLDKTVATPAIPAGQAMMAIDADDNGVLLMTVFALIGNATHSQTVDFYVWKDGLDAQPTKIFTKPATEVIASGDIGRTISVKGDLLNGTAVIGLLAKTLKQGLMYRVENGEVTNDGNPVWRGDFGVACNNNGKIIPMDTGENPAYILSGVAPGTMQYYCTTNPSSTLSLTMNTIWRTGHNKGADVVDFNGLRLLATQNGNSVFGAAGGDAANRLIVADITAYDVDAFTSKRIMDSRMQNYDKNVVDPATGNMRPENATMTGMTSTYGHIPGTYSLGANGNWTGDVCFGSNADGSAVQVYLMTTNHGLFAYEISKFKPF